MFEREGVDLLAQTRNIFFSHRESRRLFMAAEFFKKPLHPYSIALLEAMPSAATRGKRLKAIPGQVPSAGNYPTGCRFHDRCPIARPDCAVNPPALLPFGDRLARCPYAII